ncbi:MAG: D-heptose-phosphate adenylyltransferase [Planctomycetaceae bacterium]|nr:D-heptose-phosphate adenylyltransferase [Planctomycetaceae bacterium]
MNLIESDRNTQRLIDLPALLERFHNVKVLVLGDLILDVYHVGNASRISPEAPIPILLNPTTEYRLGGAAAVAAMCAALGANVSLVGVTGADRNGTTVRTLAELAGVSLVATVDSTRPTTTKERICGIASGRHRQQLGRMDHESTEPLNRVTEASLCEIIHGALDCNPDIILVSDYGKGVCGETIVLQLQSVFQKVIVDPPKVSGWFEKYKGVSCVVPNRQEAAGYSARQIQIRLGSDAVVVKLDEEGCELCCYDAPHDAYSGAHIPTQSKAVHDVTGAGDQFLATLGCARAVGVEWFAAAQLANRTAGVQVERHGCVPVTPGELSAICREKAGGLMDIGTSFHLR